MLSSVASDAEVGWFEGTEGFVPDLGLSTPSCGDGVAQEKQLGFSIFCNFDE